MNADGARGMGVRGANMDWGANTGACAVDGAKGEVNGASDMV